VIDVKFASFAKAALCVGLVQFGAFFALFIGYMAVAVYGCDPAWGAARLWREPVGRGALGLGAVLVAATVGQACDSSRNVFRAFRSAYFGSVWNYCDLASCALVPLIFVLHVARASPQLFVILVAAETLVLCVRFLYYLMAAENFGALLRMTLMVVQSMRHFLGLLFFLLISFSLTFGVLLSRGAPSDKAAGAGEATEIAAAAAVELTGGADALAFRGALTLSSFGTSLLSLFTAMLGDVPYSRFASILAMGTSAARLAVVLLVIYSVLVLVVLLNLLIATVVKTHEAVSESEANTILRNKALIIDEIESTLSDAAVDDLNAHVLLPFIHVLMPQQQGGGGGEGWGGPAAASDGGAMPAATGRGGASGGGGGGGGSGRRLEVADKLSKLKRQLKASAQEHAAEMAALRAQVAAAAAASASASASAAGLALGGAFGAAGGGEAGAAARAATAAAACASAAASAAQAMMQEQQALAAAVCGLAERVESAALSGGGGGAEGESAAARLGALQADVSALKGLLVELLAAQDRVGGSGGGGPAA